MKEAFNHDKNAWGGRWLHSLAKHYGFRLDVPFSNLPDSTKESDFQRQQGNQDRDCPARRRAPRRAARGQEDGLSRRRAANRAPLSLVPQARPQQRRHGGLPAKGHGGLRLPGLRRGAVAKNAGPGASRRQNTARSGRTALARPATVAPNARHRRGQNGGGFHRNARDRNARGSAHQYRFGYLNLNRRSGTLSGGESQKFVSRLRLGPA